MGQVVVAPSERGSADSLTLLFAPDPPGLEDPGSPTWRNARESMSSCDTAQEGVETSPGPAQVPIIALNAFTTWRNTAPFPPRTAFAKRLEKTPARGALPSPFGPPEKGVEQMRRGRGPSL